MPTSKLSLNSRSVVVASRCTHKPKCFALRMTTPHAQPTISDKEEQTYPAQHHFASLILYRYATQNNTITINRAHAARFRFSKTTLHTNFCLLPCFRNDRIIPAKTQSKCHICLNKTRSMRNAYYISTDSFKNYSFRPLFTTALSFSFFTSSQPCLHTPHI